ncbi:hypothetical protein DC74_p00017 (plasmid) [Streptomyces noursei]|nr:hypothetical protein DC74_p00017 [Streptomyces noursei]
MSLRLDLVLMVGWVWVAVRPSGPGPARRAAFSEATGTAGPADQVT